MALKLVALQFVALRLHAKRTFLSLIRNSSKPRTTPPPLRSNFHNSREHTIMSTANSSSEGENTWVTGRKGQDEGITLPNFPLAAGD